jgi:hypothetical protein
LPTSGRTTPRLLNRHLDIFVGLLKDWELMEGDIIAIDSFKIRAQNALKNNFNQKK